MISIAVSKSERFALYQYPGGMGWPVLELMLNDELQGWIDRNIRGNWYWEEKEHSYVFYFASEADANAFEFEIDQ